MIKNLNGLSTFKQIHEAGHIKDTVEGKSIVLKCLAQGHNICGSGRH